MFGWWLELEGEALPVVANNTDVKVTTYLHYGHAALVAVASFAATEVPVTFAVNFTTLGLPASTPWSIPQIPPFQNATTFGPGQAVTLQPQYGGVIFGIGSW